jgi:biotin transport system substrate-specific component
MDVLLKKELVVNKTITGVLGVCTFIILTALGAFVRIPLPLTPVPVTLQTFFVLLSGALLGRKLGVASQASYVLLGIAGIPLFTSSGSGLLYVLGPTGGYLAGFIVASFFIATALPRIENSHRSIFCAMMLADMMILLCGSLWLKIGYHYSLSEALLAGMVPFVAADAVKAFIAAAIYKKLRLRLTQIL